MANTPEEFFSKYLKIGKFYSISPNVWVIERWNWDYQESLTFQRLAMSFVKEHREIQFYICCNHPSCFTIGRGLQKGTGVKDFTEFDESLINRLRFPLHRIKRGGGITFHYPGQWIFYPIVSLNNHQLTLKGIINLMLAGAKQILLEEFSISDLDYERELLGLWYKEYKIASVGIGVERFVTYHGMALNLYNDEDVFNELNKINPCGLKGKTYKTVESLVGNQDLLNRFQRAFVESILRKKFPV